MTTVANTKPVDYTVDVYVADKRTKKGERHFRRIEIVQCLPQDLAEELQIIEAGIKKEKARVHFRMDVNTTWVEKVNLMSGKVFTERFDTPYYCSPSSETYWSM